MKAVDFIKKFGWGEAKRVLHDAKGCASVRLYGTYEFSTNDLKQYVDAYELVQKHRGLGNAKKDIIDAEYFGMNMIFGTNLKVLSQAIALVEEVECK